MYGKMGRDRVLDKFTWERAARELVDVYKEAIINAKNIPSEVLTSINDAKTVITVSTANAPKTIR